MGEKAKEGFMGAGGKKTFTFKVNPTAVKGSFCQIGFTHERAWNLKGEWKLHPQKSFTIQIV